MKLFRLSLCALTVFVAGCAASSLYQYDLIPIPVALEGIEREAGSNYVDVAPYDGVLYVTDREPVGPDDTEHHYTSEHASALRVGAAQVAYAGKPRSDDELRELALQEPGKKRDFPLAVNGLDEFGYLSSALPYDFLTSADEFGTTPAADDRFAMLINQKLAASKSKDVYIYVPGYKIVFENPVIVSAQLWHFLNYEGVFLSFAWASTPKRFAYIKDSQTAEISARNFRLLLQFIMRSTDAERVHILGYSAGTRVVIGALHQLALLQGGRSPSPGQGRIGQVALIGSDYDRQRWVANVADGLLEVSDALTIYVSPYDGALGLSRMVFGQTRLGQVEDDSFPETVRDWLQSSERLFFVDVSEVEGSSLRGGHSYFQTSPWISSDILAKLRYGLTPAERGLVRNPDKLSWSFPPEYDVGLKKIIEMRAQ